VLFSSMLLCWFTLQLSPSLFSVFLARDAFVTTNRRAIVTMFARLSVRPSVVCHGLQGRACNAVHYYHAVHFSTDLGLWLDSSMFWAA